MIQSPYPKSDVIKGIRWLTENQPYMPSNGDVWSCAWADDDNLYSAADDCGGINNSNTSNLAVFRIPGTPMAPEAGKPTAGPAWTACCTWVSANIRGPGTFLTRCNARTMAASSNQLTTA